jgi:hypothetical protein
MIFTVDEPWSFLDGENQSQAYLEKPFCNKTSLTGEPVPLKVSVHPRDVNHCPPEWEANG